MTENEIAGNPEIEQADEQQARGRGRKNKKKNWPLRIGVIVGILAVLAAAVVILLNTNLFGNGEVIEDEWKTPEYLRSKTMTILVAGLDDVKEEERTDLLTDVIMVVNLDLENYTATMLQIPRDTYVGNIVYYSKINGIYNWGLLDEDGNEIGVKGMAPLVETVHEQFCLPIDYYVLVTLDGLADVVDRLGGIEITIDEELTLTDDIVYEPGTYVIDGETTKLFVRSRNYKDADVKRQDVQRYILAALFQRALSCSKGEMVGLVNELYDDIETDFSINELLSLASQAKNFSMANIKMMRVPGEGVRRYGLYGVDVYSVHKDQLADLLNQFMRPYTDDVPASELPVIEIQNTDDTWDDPNYGTLEDYD